MSGTFCGNRHHIIVPLKPRVSSCPMRMNNKVWRFLSLVPMHMICSVRRQSRTAFSRPSPTALQIIWKYFSVASASHRSQTVADRYRSYRSQTQFEIILDPVVQSPISTSPGLTLIKTYRANPGSELIWLRITGPRVPFTFTFSF